MRGHFSLKSVFVADKTGGVSLPGDQDIVYMHTDANMVDPHRLSKRGGGCRGIKFTLFEYLKWQHTAAELESE